MNALINCLSLLFFSVMANGQSLKPGEHAPHFVLEGSDGKSYSLEQYIGKQGVVLAWFPKAFTPG